MVKAKLQLENGANLYLFGLSGANLVRLMKGQPINIKLKDMGSGNKDEVLLLAAETEQDIMDDLTRQGLLPADKVSIDSTPQ